MLKLSKIRFSDYALQKVPIYAKKSSAIVSTVRMSDFYKFMTIVRQAFDHEICTDYDSRHFLQIFLKLGITRFSHGRAIYLFTIIT